MKWFQLLCASFLSFLLLSCASSPETEDVATQTPVVVTRQVVVTEEVVVTEVVTEYVEVEVTRVQTPAATELTTNYYDAADFLAQLSGNYGPLPAFSVELPLDWNFDWSSDSGVLVFIASTDFPSRSFWLAQQEGAALFISPARYASEPDPPESLVGSSSADEILEKPHTITVNGHPAARAVYLNNDQFVIDMVFQEDSLALSVAAVAYGDDIPHYQPILEQIVASIRFVGDPGSP